MINGERLDKPFVEKPVNAEDHEIVIYYTSTSPCGAGYNVLFRKTDDYCSQFIPCQRVSRIRKKGSYIYEEFLATDGFDIKVYTVGNEYAHAEARKSPTLDERVQVSNKISLDPIHQCLFFSARRERKRGSISCKPDRTRTGNRKEDFNRL